METLAQPAQAAEAAALDEPQLSGGSLVGPATQSLAAGGDDDSSVTSSEGDRGAGEASKAVPTVDARVSALKALAGIGTVVSKSRKVDAEALQQIKQQRARAKAEQAASGAGQAGTAAGAEPQMLGGEPRSLSMESGIINAGALIRHLSVSSGPPLGSPLFATAHAAGAAGGAAAPMHPLPTSAAPASTIASAGGSGCFPQGYTQPAAALPVPGTHQHGLLRPQRSVPAGFAPQQGPQPASVGNPFAQPRPTAAPQQQQQQRQQPLMVGVGDAVAAAALSGLPPSPFGDVLPTLSLQELLSLRAAVEGLLVQRAQLPAPSQGTAFAPEGASLHQQPQVVLAQQQAQHAEHVLQQAQHAEHAYKQYQQAQRAQQAQAILQSLSAAAASNGSNGGLPSGAGGYSSPPAQAGQQPQQPPTPFLVAAEERAISSSSKIGGGLAVGSGSFSPIHPLDAVVRQNSGNSLSPSASGPILDHAAVAEQHLLGNSLSSVMEVSTASLHLPDACNGWATGDGGLLPRSISCPTDRLAATRPVSLSGYLGSDNAQVTALLHSLNLSMGTWEEEPAATPILGPAPTAQGIFSAGGAAVAAQPQQPGLGLPPAPRPAYRSVRFRDGAAPMPSMLPPGY